jgi:cytochrome P450
LNKLLAAGAMDYFPDKAAQDTMRFFRLSEAKLKQREALEKEFNNSSSAPSRRDIIHYLLKSRDPETGRGFTKTQLHADSGLLIAAGSDGVAMILSSALFYLLSNPSTLKALESEVRSNFNHVDEIGMPKLGTLHYLQAVIDETMRMTPPLPSALPRKVLKGGLTVDGIHVPEGIDVGVPAYAIHHNELYFPRSYLFSPERWLVRDKDEMRNKELAFTRKAFVPFSLGPFNCIGRPVAYLACKLSLAKLVYMYDVKKAGEKLVGEMEKRPAEYAMVDWLVGYRNGPVVQFKSRQDT